MVFVKNCSFSHSFFLVKICHLEVFFDILHREIGFLDHKKNGLEKVAKFAFFQSMVFVKNCNVSHCFLFKIRQIKVFNDVLDR